MQELPSIENLRCFEAAARVASFRAAAKLVALTPAAFGQRIRQLEEQLGGALFVRTTRSIQLTPGGAALLPQARQILIAAGECARLVRDERSAPLHLTIGARFELGLSWLLPLIPELERELPQLRVDLYTSSGLDLLRHLHDGELDCAVTSSQLPDSSFEGEVLQEERYVFVGAASLLERVPFRRRHDAAHHCLLDISAEFPLFRYLRDAPGLRGPISFGSQRYLGLGEAVRRWVVAGEGLAVLPVYMVEAELERGTLVRLLRSVELLRDHFRLVFRSSDLRRERFFELAELLRASPLCA